MGLFGFFRSKKKVEEPVKEISISEGDSLLEQELKKENEKVNEVKGEINGRIVEFVSGLREQINVLNLIDIEEKREDERIKFMTLQGLEEYIEELEKFMENLEKANKGAEFYQYAKEIDLAVDIFLRNSRKKLEKATILIGKELAQTEEMIKAFHKEVDMVVRQNSRIISRIRSISRLSELRDSVCGAGKIRERISNSLGDLKKEKGAIIEKKSERERGLSLFMGSEECKCWFEEKATLGKERRALDEDIRELKEKIDFKLLLNKFHSIPKSLELLKDYRNDFFGTLMNDGKFKILDMLEGDEKEIIGERLKGISEKIRNLKLKEDSYKVNKKERAFRSDIKKADYQIEIVDKKIEEENKKLGKFVGKEKELRQEEVRAMEKILGNVRIVGELKREHD